MSTLTVELPDKQLALLVRTAQARGTSIDELVAALVDTIAVQDEANSEFDVTSDPLYTMQAHDSTAPTDLAQNVDTYLYGTPS